MKMFTQVFLVKNWKRPKRATTGKWEKSQCFYTKERNAADKLFHRENAKEEVCTLYLM